jgi:uncharacterized cupin superfamily protein
VVREARLEPNESGLAPGEDGWFVVNVRETAWLTNEHFGSTCVFEGTEAHFSQLGISLHVLQPGQPNGLYHAESNQEDFLVLSGECLLLVEDEERTLRAWDFVHCPPNTEHIFVGAGDGPCVVLMTGRRDPERTIVYPASELARRHSAGVETETSSPAEAYASYPDFQLERPPYWDELPWSDRRNVSA